MAVTLSVIVAKDGAGATIVGGVQAIDLSGAGTGPWSPGNVILDGLLGVQRAAVVAVNTAPVTATHPALVSVLRPDSAGIITTGTAGSASTQVLTVQGIAAMTPILATLSGTNNIATVTTVTTVSAVTAITNAVTLASQGTGIAATFTPAASSHTANDVVGGAQNWALTGISGSTVIITGAAFLINTATAQVSTWRVYLYNVTPPSALADDTAWDLPSGDQASFLGYIDLGTAIDLGSTQFVQVTGVNLEVKQAGTGLFGYLVNGTTLTTAAVAHIVTLQIVQA